MRKVALLTCLAFVPLPVVAEVLSCDALKARVDAKLQAKGVSSYTLDVEAAEGSSDTTGNASAVPASRTSKGKEVGTCNGGTKRLIYTKGN
jgi:hypothetical protein